MKAVLVRIGVDQAYGVWNAPADPDTEEFVYVPIPEKNGTRFHPGCKRPYSEVVPSLQQFAAGLKLDLFSDLKCPPELLAKSMHLDPDFACLTYGDVGDRRGSDLRNLKEDDLVVFYAGMRPTGPCEHKLIYALVGLFVVSEVVDAKSVPKARWSENAHTRKVKRGESDIVVRAKPVVSGRLRRFIPIGEYRSRAYRVRKDVLDAWGGLSVKDGFIQRSARPPKFLDAQRFYKWFKSMGVPLLAANNPISKSSDPTRVIVVHLRRPEKRNPNEMRSDPFWEFGSFGCTGCHKKNLMNPKRIGELVGARMAFAQGGVEGFKLVMLTPPIEIIRHSDRCELRWKPTDPPFRYGTAPLIVDQKGRSDLPKLKRMIRMVNRTTWIARFSSKFRSSRTPLPVHVASEVCDVFDARRHNAGEGELATTYDLALPYKPNRIDQARADTYGKLLAKASGTEADGATPFDPAIHQIEYSRGDCQKWLWLRPNKALVGYEDRSDYALTIDGYKYAEENWREDTSRGDSGRRIEEVLKGHIDGYGFADLRALLFLIQRAIKWTEGSVGCEPAVRKLLGGFDLVYERLCEIWGEASVDHCEEVRVCSDRLRRLTE